MAKPKFRLEVSFDKTTGKPVAAYLRVREGKVAETREARGGVAFADYGVDGCLLGVELLDRLSEKKPEAVRRGRHGGGDLLRGLQRRKARVGVPRGFGTRG